MGPPQDEEWNEEDDADADADADAAAAVTGPRGPAHMDISAQFRTELLLVGRNRRVAALPAASIPEVKVAIVLFFL